MIDVPKREFLNYVHPAAVLVNVRFWEHFGVQQNANSIRCIQMWVQNLIQT